MVTVTVVPVNDPPVLATLLDISFDEGGSDTLELSASDVDDTELTYSITAGSDITASLDMDTVTFSADENYNGSENFTVSVTDGDLTDSQVITVTINAVNDAPVAGTGITGTTPEGASVSIALSGTDVDGDVLTFTSFVEPLYGTVSISGSYATYTPNDDNNGGDDTFTFTVSDGILTDDAVVTVTVVPVNDPPVLADINDFSFDEDIIYTLELFDNEGNSIAQDVDGDDLSYVIEGGNNIVAVIDGDTIIFTPSENFNGVESFIITVSDGELTDSQIIIITVNAVNDNPEALDITLDINEDEVTTIILNGLDVDGDAITYSIVDAPNGNISVPEGAIVSYTPEENSTEEDSFSYKVSDGLLDSDIATVILNINDVNDAPVIDSIVNQTIDEDEDPHLQLPIIAIDVDGDNLIYDYLPEDNALIWFEENILNVKPNTDYYGQLSITVIVSDGLLNSTTEFILDVISVNDPPIADNMSVVLYEDTSTTFNFNANDVDNFNLSYTIDLEPEHGDYNINSGFITYTPDENYFGLDELFFVVSDGEFTADGTIYIEVLNIDDPFTITSEPSLDATEDLEYIYQVLLDDPDLDDSIEYLLSNEPDGMIITNDAGLLTWTPGEGITTSGLITITIDDNTDIDNEGNPIDGNVVNQSFIINVLSVNDPPQITSLPIINSYVDEEYIYQLDIDDPDNDTFEFLLTNHPTGMSVDESGVITWTPLSTGYYPDISIQVSDEEFLVEQIFDIDIKVLQQFDFLHSNNNLISFIGLNEENNSIESIFNNISNSLTHIFTENYASIYLDSFGWFGSIDTLQAKKGYWIRLDQEEWSDDDNFELETYRFIDSTNDLVYNLHFGPNLISYIGSNIYDNIDDILPDDVEHLFLDIIGENSSATRLSNGQWAGTLANNGLEPLRGYWVNVSEDLDFSYNFTEDLARNNNNIINVNISDVPDEFHYNQSQNQAFYFFKNIIVNGEKITEDDWIIAFNDNVVVGARKWFGEYTEVPVMGYDGFDETVGYCENNSKVTFKVYKSSNNELIDISGNTPNWSNLSNFVIDDTQENFSYPDKYKINMPYPNPFNPVLNIDLEISGNEKININIYNIKGQLVEALIDSKSFERGYHTISWDASRFSSGIYLVKFESNSSKIVKKVTLLK